MERKSVYDNHPHRLACKTFGQMHRCLDSLCCTFRSLCSGTVCHTNVVVVVPVQHFDYVDMKRKSSEAFLAQSHARQRSFV